MKAAVACLFALAAAFCFGQASAAEDPALEVQRYLAACIKATSVKMAEWPYFAKALDGRPCSEPFLQIENFGAVSTTAVKSSRIKITGTGQEDFVVVVIDRQGKQRFGDPSHIPQVPMRKAALPTFFPAGYTGLPVSHGGSALALS